MENKMKKLSIFFFIITFINVASGPLNCASYPPLEVRWDENIEKLIKSKIDNYKLLTFEIIPELTLVYNEMWLEFNAEYEKWKNSGGDEGKLPWCIFEAINDLKKKGKIIIYFSIRHLNDFPSGRLAIFSTRGEYFSVKMEKKEWEGMWIFGLWKKSYRESIDSPLYCLKAIIFHELLHYSLDISDRNYFNVRSIKNPKVTDNNNFWSDEGIIEDCQLKFFPCGEVIYIDHEEDWYRNNARKYNTSDADCISCKLCKEKSN